MNGSHVRGYVAVLLLAIVGWSPVHTNLSCAAPPSGALPHPVVPQRDKSGAKENIAAAAQKISGRAFDAHGTPVEGATLWLTRNEDKDYLPVPEVIAETHSRVDGRFELAISSSELKRQTEDFDTGLELWVWKAGFAVGHTTFFGQPPAHFVTFSLRNESPISLVIKNPKGTPCNGASVSPAIAWFSYARAIPMPLRARLTTRSDGDGRVELVGFNADLTAARIEKAEFGIQTLMLPQDLSSSIPVTLRETRDTTGRIVIPEGIKVDFAHMNLIFGISSETRAEREKREWQQIDRAPSGTCLQQFSVHPTNDGRFQLLRVLDRGTSHVTANGHADLHLVFSADKPRSQQSQAKRAEVEITLLKGIGCEAVVRDSHSKRPLPGVSVAFVHKLPADPKAKFKTGGNEMRSFELPIVAGTDEHGRLSAAVLAGETYYVHCVLPKGYLGPLSGCETEIAIPAGVDGFALPVIELVRATKVQGRLFDSADKPLPGVRVRGSWHEQTKEGKAAAADVVHWTTTDRAGHFQFDEVGADTNVALLPIRAGVPLCDAVKIVGGDDKPVLLKAKHEELVALSGRVLGTDHKPIPDAQIVIEIGDSPDPSSAFPMSADANGSIRTPDQFPKRLKYRLTVRSMLDVVASSDWMCPAVAGAKFPDLVVDRAKLSLGVRLSGKETVARVNGRPIYASELLERAFVEPLTPDKQTLYAASSMVADGRMTEREFRSLQELAIKKFLSEFVRTHLLTQVLLHSLDAEVKKRIEDAVVNEFNNYVEKLKKDFRVTTKDEVDRQLRKQGVSLDHLQAEFRHRVLADEWSRSNFPDSELVWTKALAYYQSNRDVFATRPMVNWQLAEINFDKGRSATDAVANGTKATSQQNGARADSYETETVPKDSIVFGAGPLGTVGKANDASSGGSSSGGSLFGKPMLDAEFPTASPRNEEKEIKKAEDEIGRVLQAAAGLGEHIGPEKAKKLMDAASKELGQGKPFADVAKKFSDGPRAKDGGWQPPTNPESLADEKTANALRHLPEGATSPVIETDHSLRIVRLVSRVPASYKPFEEVEASIRERIRQQLQEKALEGIFSKAVIESAYPLGASNKRVGASFEDEVPPELPK